MSEQTSSPPPYGIGRSEAGSQGVDRLEHRRLQRRVGARQKADDRAERGRGERHPRLEHRRPRVGGGDDDHGQRPHHRAQHPSGEPERRAFEQELDGDVTAGCVGPLGRIASGASAAITVAARTFDSIWTVPGAPRPNSRRAVPSGMMIALSSDAAVAHRRGIPTTT